jgi:hypothetical protein
MALKLETDDEAGIASAEAWKKTAKGIEMEESTEQEQLEAAYRTAFAARIKAGNRVLDLFPKGRIGPQGAGELNEALAADYAAEQELAKAREAYSAATKRGTAFGSL